jgi:hypothetical protein
MWKKQISFPEYMYRVGHAPKDSLCGTFGDIFVKIKSTNLILGTSIIDKAIKRQRSISVSFIFIVLMYP